MGKMQRNKGARWERDVAKMLAFLGAKRGLGQARSGGEVADVSNPYFWVECKVGAAPPIRPALQQAAKANPVGSGLYPIAVVKEDRCAPTVTMFLDDWVALVKEWHERGLR